MRLSHQVRCPRPRRKRFPARLHLENLETRCLPAPLAWPGLTQPIAALGSNTTLDQAQELGNLTTTPRAEVVGTLGPAEVDWYTFALTSPADLHLATLDQGVDHSLTSVLSLYNNDPYDPLQHRLLAQDDGAGHGGDARLDRLLGAGHGGDARLDRLLGPGTYFVAVSGSGDRYFHPFVAGSGYAGSTGAYGLQITATAAGVAPTDGPAVLTTDPAPGSTLDRSPFVIRVDLSGPLDPATFVYAAPGQDPSTYASPAPGQTVELRFSPAGDFSPGQYSDIPITPTFSSAANELLIAPAAPLGPGIYQLFLAGDSTGGAAVLTDPSADAVPLGKTDQSPNGADYTAAFQIDGIAGVAGAAAAPNTLATARQLGDITGAGLLQLPGAIGIDPTAATPFDPTGVNLYHFQVNGPGRFALTAEAFAGRIGSPLDPVLALFQYQAADQSLRLVGWNDNTLNDTPATQGPPPLSNDPVLFAGLTAGDYYLAVYSSGSVPNTAPGLVPDPDGPVDPTAVFHSPAGVTTGDYVLNLGVQSVGQSPHVLDATPADGSTLQGPPTQLVVHFSEPVNLQQLAYQQDQQAGSGGLAAVFVRGADGNTYFPRFQSYDPDSGQAIFLMLDALPGGVNELHLSGPLGLADLAGNPLTGNDAGGDYVVRFTVPDLPRGSPGQPLTWQFTAPSHDAAQPQPVGILFPHDLEAGVTLERQASDGSANDPTDVADYYQFQILQGRPYFFSLTGSNLPADAQPTLTDAAGNAIPLLPQGDGSLFLVSLDPGVYVVGVGGWTADEAADVTYQLGITLGPSQENPTPLTVRPAPAFRLLLAGTPAPPPTPTPTPTPTSPPPDSSPSVPPSTPAGDPSTPPAPPAPPTAAPSNPPTPVVSSPPAQPTPPVSSPPAASPSTPPVTVSLPPAPPSSPPPSPPSPSNPPATPVVGPAAPAESAGSRTATGPATVVTGPLSPAEAAPRLVLPPPTGTITGSQTIQMVARETPPDYRSVGSSLAEVTAGRSDVPAISNGVVAGFTREAANDGRFTLALPANAPGTLSSAPVGGIRGATTPEQDPTPPQRLQVQRVDGAEATPRNRATQELLRTWQKLWQQRLDRFFAETFSGWNLLDWLKQFEGPAPDAAPRPAETKPEDQAEPEAALPGAHSTETAESGTAWAWAGGVFLLGMMYPPDGRRRFRVRPLLGRREG